MGIIIFFLGSSYLSGAAGNDRSSKVQSIRGGGMPVAAHLKAMV